MRVLADNAALRATITSENETVNYAPANLVHDFLQKRWQPSTGTSNKITVTFDTTENINCFFYGYFQCDSITVELFDGGGSLESKAADLTYPTNVVYFDATRSATYAEITVARSSGTMYLGGIGLGVYYQMPDPEWQYSEVLVDNSSLVSSAYGQYLQNRISTRRQFPYSFIVTKTIADAIRSTFDDTGIGGKVWVDFYAELHSWLHPEYCILSELSPARRTTSGHHFNMDIEFTEAK